jgi:hypothetical protein
MVEVKGWLRTPFSPALFFILKNISFINNQKTPLKLILLLIACLNSDPVSYLSKSPPLTQDNE